LLLLIIPFSGLVLAYVCIACLGFVSKLWLWDWLSPGNMGWNIIRVDHAG
jgi:hypothetical protein